MTDYGPMENVYPNPVGGRDWFGTCPNCGTIGRIDEDQVEGRVSIICPDCDYHETHNHRPLDEENFP